VQRFIETSFRFIFFFAGADTSSTSIAYTIVELGIHPEIQEKLREEIVAKSGEEITYENLQEMTYLNKVVNGKVC
jgi:cytochrome P450